MKKFIAAMAMAGFLASVGAASAADKPEGKKKEKASVSAKAETKPTETKPSTETKPTETKPVKKKAKEKTKESSGY